MTKCHYCKSEITEGLAMTDWIIRLLKELHEREVYELGDEKGKETGLFNLTDMKGKDSPTFTIETVSELVRLGWIKPFEFRGSTLYKRVTPDDK